MDKDHALTILKKCCPGADNMRIIQNHVEDGQRHLSSDVVRFIVEYEQNDSTHRLHVAMKVPTPSTLFSASDENNVYDKENGIYEKVIPRINQYLHKSLTPAHLFTDDSKILVLEDLTARGYHTGEKLTSLDLSQIKCVVKAIANFHAASHRLYKEDPNILENVLDSHLDGTVSRQIVTTWGSVILEMLKRKNESRLIPKVEAAISFFQKEDDQVAAVLDKSNYKFVVLNHGDCRKDNCLFKYTSDNRVQVQFVDFQISIWSSPAFDILYFLTTSASADILEAHFDDLIDEYLRELNEKLENLQCAKTYRRKDFDEDFKMLKHFLFYSLSCLCGIVSPLNRQRVAESFSQSNVDISHLCELCLKDEQFVRVIYRWLKFLEKSTIFDEF